MGAYLFSYANTLDGAELEAENCLRFIKGKEFELPIFYDLEDNVTTGLADKYTITQMAKIFCRRLKNAGYKAGIYASLYWFNEKMYITELEECFIWLAQWNSTNDATFKVDLWQYTSDGHISGINGRVDLNYSYGEITKIVENVNNFVENSTNKRKGRKNESISKWKYT